MTDQNQKPQTSDFTDDELHTEENRIIGKVRRFAIFKVVLPDTDDGDDTARAEVSTEILQALERVSAKHKGMELYYNFGSDMCQPEQIKLIG